jgi:hypothetical protein
MRWVGAGCKLFSRVLSWALLVALVGLWWSSMAPEHAERVPGLLNKAWARGSEAVFGGNETSSAAMPVTTS